MLVRFWGTRGSIATPGTATARYGGNTSCVEIRSGNTVAVLDCGTGARLLGVQLAASSELRVIHLMLTHFHWDHIQGFPFFPPAFRPGVELHVYGPAGLEQGLVDAMAGQMQYTYFPIRLDELGARFTFHEVGETTFRAGRFDVRTLFLNHTCPAIGYRLTAGGARIAYMTDHEPFWPHNPNLSMSEALVHPGDSRHVAFLTGVDLLIHDSQYLSDEYPARRGWGHSTVEYVVDVALAAGVQRLALFHHDPARLDDAMERLVALAIERVHARGGRLEVFAAAEAQSVEISESGRPVRRSTRRAPSQVRAGRLLLVGVPERRRVLRQALVEDGYHVREAELDVSMAELMLGEQDLVLLAPPPQGDPVALARATKRTVRDPIAVVLEGSLEDQVLHQLSEVAADVIVPPYTLPILRTRIRSCLTREKIAALEPATSHTESLQLVERLPSVELEAMLREGSRVAFRAGEFLMHQGDPPGGMYYLQQGVVRVYLEADAGREITLGTAGPGDTIGEMSALDGSPRSATVVAMEPVEATFISRETFASTLERSPATAIRVLRTLVRRLRETDRRLQTEAASLPVVASPPRANVQMRQG